MYLLVAKQEFPIQHIRSQCYTDQKKVKENSEQKTHTKTQVSTRRVKRHKTNEPNKFERQFGTSKWEYDDYTHTIVVISIEHLAGRTTTWPESGETPERGGKQMVRADKEVLNGLFN